MSSNIVIAAEKIHELTNIRTLTPSAYVLRFDKNEIDFKAGQYITVGKENIEPRQYSVYSPANANYLEVLIKEVEEGKVSKQLKHCTPGDKLLVDGPFGHFTIKKEHIANRKLLFIGTGTGISPFHSFVGTYPEMDYTLLHGVRYANEAYEKDFYQKERFVLCSSRDNKGDYQGRVTDYIRQYPVNKNTEVYLCGNSEMILEVFDILEEQRFPTEQIHTEVYF